HLSPKAIFERARLDLSHLLSAYENLPPHEPFFREDGYFLLLSGTPRLREQIESGWTEAQIRASWEGELSAYRKLRQKYLLYPD
ncbi:MAG: DUF1343 domain-containing protein, partial [Saprospiraceae bacterium]|nr:DUF1343 domain-containing protein [Saprospiraceae bacterium]